MRDRRAIPAYRRGARLRRVPRLMRATKFQTPQPSAPGGPYAGGLEPAPGRRQVGYAPRERWNLCGAAIGSQCHELTSAWGLRHRCEASRLSCTIRFDGLFERLHVGIPKFHSGRGYAPETIRQCGEALADTVRFTRYPDEAHRRGQLKDGTAPVGSALGGGPVERSRCVGNQAGGRPVAISGGAAREDRERIETVQVKVQAPPWLEGGVSSNTVPAPFAPPNTVVP